MSVRLINNAGRAGVEVAGRVVDVEKRSNGKFSSDLTSIVDKWDAFVSWAGGLKAGDADAALDESALGPPVPRPAKVFGIGMNYREHAKEAGLEIPTSPVVFTKFPNCIAGPRTDVVLSSTYVDWEVELVVVVGRRGRAIPAARAFDYVAGYCAGQDISDRKAQFADKPPQFSMGKSYDTFGPIGPALVSIIDGFAKPNDLALTCD